MQMKKKTNKVIKKEDVNEGPKTDSRLRKGLTKIQDDSYKLLANYRTCLLYTSPSPRD